MVLHFNADQVLFDTEVTDETVHLINTKECVCSRISQFKDSPVQHVTSSDGCLYVNQREYGTLWRKSSATPDSDDGISSIGSDDATTCHILILTVKDDSISSTEERCVLIHVDQEVDELKHLSSWVEQLEISEVNNKMINVSVVGGFSDALSVSNAITISLLSAVVNSKFHFKLDLFLTAHHNTHVIDGVKKPIFYGCTYNMKDGVLRPAIFSIESRGPEYIYRQVRIMFGENSDEYYSIFNSHRSSNSVNIPPFPINSRYLHDEGAENYFNIWLANMASDKEVLRVMSTSPDAEPDHFCDTSRKCVQQFLSMLKSRPLNLKERVFLFKREDDKMNTWSEVCETAT